MLSEPGVQRRRSSKREARRAPARTSRQEQRAPSRATSAETLCVPTARRAVTLAAAPAPHRGKPALRCLVGLLPCRSACSAVRVPAMSGRCAATRAAASARRPVKLATLALAPGKYSTQRAKFAAWPHAMWASCVVTQVAESVRYLAPIARARFASSPQLESRSRRRARRPGWVRA
jgi:hypothetical protein